MEDNICFTVKLYRTNCQELELSGNSKKKRWKNRFNEENIVESGEKTDSLGIYKHGVSN